MFLFTQFGLLPTYVHVNLCFIYCNSHLGIGERLSCAIYVSLLL